MKVLDHGYVELLDHMGNDLMVANAARCSYGKRHEELTKADIELIKGIGPKGHVGPFKHPKIQLAMKIPIFVFRQLVTHRIGIEWADDDMDLSEKSLRYTDASGIDFYSPSIDRFDPNIFVASCEDSLNAYKSMRLAGVKPEVARMVLPVTIYTEVMMTTSLLAVAHLINLRDDSHAQWEAQQYAKAIKELVEPLFPVSLNALLEVK